MGRLAGGGTTKFAGPQSLLRRGVAGQKPAVINVSNNIIDDIALQKEMGQNSTLGRAKNSQMTAHNPITNPLAYVNQNPYVQKQMEAAKRKSIMEYSQSNSMDQLLSPTASPTKTAVTLAKNFKNDTSAVHQSMNFLTPRKLDTINNNSASYTRNSVMGHMPITSKGGTTHPNTHTILSDQRLKASNTVSLPQKEYDYPIPSKAERSYSNLAAPP